MKKFCPDCGEKTLYEIERTTPDFTGEFKVVMTCDRCSNIVYLVIDGDHPELPQGDIDHDDEDRRAYNEEKNERKPASDH